MRIHEWQAKELLGRYGVAVPRGRVTDDPAEAGRIARGYGGRAVVKAQIHAGGRGKGGGVRIGATPDEVEAHARRILGMRLVTPQTGPGGRKVRSVLIQEDVAIARELYVAVTLDRAAGAPVLVASAHGGMEIEALAAERPEAIHREGFDPRLGLKPFQARRVARKLGLSSAAAAGGEALLAALCRAWLETDASLVEINPLVLSAGGAVLALDAKIAFDDSALFRHPDIAAMRDTDEEEPLEVEASRLGLNYVKLDGEIGCMVNGAGLAMATMDIIGLEGSAPANFLDVGGSASPEAVAGAFKILVSDPAVKAVLVNIFGGIARTDRIAGGIVAALRELGASRVPVVVRLEGTNVEEGRRILRESPYPFILADTMRDAAVKAVAASRMDPAFAARAAAAGAKGGA